MSEIGNITVKIGADTYELQKGLADAKTQLTGMERAAGGVESTLKAVAGVAVVAATAIAAITKSIPAAKRPRMIFLIFAFVL